MKEIKSEEDERRISDEEECKNLIDQNRQGSEPLLPEKSMEDESKIEASQNNMQEKQKYPDKKEEFINLEESFLKKSIPEMVHPGEIKKQNRASINTPLQIPSKLKSSEIATSVPGTRTSAVSKRTVEQTVPPQNLEQPIESVGSSLDKQYITPNLSPNQQEQPSSVDPTLNTEPLIKYSIIDPSLMIDPATLPLSQKNNTRHPTKQFSYNSPQDSASKEPSPKARSPSEKKDENMSALPEEQKYTPEKSPCIPELETSSCPNMMSPQ